MDRDRGDVSVLAARTLAIVVHYGDPAVTDRCLQSIARGSALPGQLAVVDNGPELVFSERLDELGVPSLLIRPGRNVGFAAGVNLALNECHGFDWVWLLNNDSEADEAALQELIKSAVRVGGRALVSSLILAGESRDVWFRRARFYPWRLESSHLRGPVRDDDAIDPGRPSVIAVPYLPGCSLLVPTIMVDAERLLDPAFFVYGEDVDLALRAQERGYALVVAGRSTVVHRADSGPATALQERLRAESAVRIVRRRFPLLVPLAISLGLAIGCWRDLQERRVRRTPARLKGYLRGMRLPRHREET